MSHRSPALSSSLFPWLLCGLAVALGGGCGPTDPAATALHIAVLMPAPADGSPRRPALEWALEAVNGGGGVAGRTLALDYVPYDPRADVETLRGTAQALVTDPGYVAVIGPGSSADLVAIADTFQAAGKPLVSPSSAAADVLRAYGGQGFLYRTRESDIAQTELLVRYGQLQGARRLALLTSLAVTGATFFSWFGFFARDRGYPSDTLRIEALPEGGPCQAAVEAALTAQPDLLFLAPATPADLECAVRAVRSRTTAPLPRIVIADTGIDVPAVLQPLGPLAEGLEGLSPISPPDVPFEEAFRARFGTQPPPYGASEYDAVLLLAYGLQVAGGRGGPALLAGLRSAVDGREGRYGWDAAGVAATLAALRVGLRADLSGATGALEFEPDLYTDLAASHLGHWVWRSDRRAFDDRFDTGDAQLRTGERALVTGAPADVQDLAASGSTWTPPTEKREVWALIAALSSGFANYRHQADALRQYQLLRQNGVPDDHIILVLADDVATARQNPLGGTVRNEPGGPDLRVGAEIDYKLPITPYQLMDILAGKPSAATPTVMNLTAASNLYVFLVGHGGQKGLAVGATTASAGLSAAASTLITPGLLRSTLCGLRSQDRLRRALIVIESCYGGVFGEASSSGIEAGCAPQGGSPPEGVVLLSAASSSEVSFAAAYDPQVGTWLADAFAREVARLIERSITSSIAELYQRAYYGVPGSHVSLYNAAAAGRLGTVPLTEFFTVR